MTRPGAKRDLHLRALYTLWQMHNKARLEGFVDVSYDRQQDVWVLLVSILLALAVSQKGPLALGHLEPREGAAFHFQPSWQ